MYSTKEQTTDPVTVRLINPSANITVTNNDGKISYTFTENGSFTFEFVDDKGRKGTATAKVDWIIKKEKPEEKPTPTPPEKPSPSKPINPSRPNLSIPNTIKPVTDPVDKTSQNIANNKKAYTTSKVTVTVPNNIIGKEERLNVENLTLSTTLQEQLGSNSENDYFEIYFETKAGQKNKLNNTVVEITIQIDPTKKLLNVYRLNDNGTLTNLSFKKIGQSKITVITTNLGKYILSYEKDQLDQKVESKNDENIIEKENSEKKKQKISKEKAPQIVIIIIASVVLIGIITLTIIKKIKESVEVI